MHPEGVVQKTVAIHTQCSQTPSALKAHSEAYEGPVVNEYSAIVQ